MLHYLYRKLHLLSMGPLPKQHHLTHHDNRHVTKARKGDTLEVCLVFDPRKGYSWEETETCSLQKITHEETALVTFLFVVRRAGVLALHYKDGSNWFEVEVAIY